MLEEEQRAQVQQVLDELFSEQLIPFELTAYLVQPNGLGEYLISFNDSRIRTCRLLWKEGQNFQEVVRAAILARVNRMSGPFSMKPKEPS